MNREEAIERLKYIAREDDSHITTADIEALEVVIKVLEQELCRNLEEIAEIIQSDVDAETKCRMISSTLTAPPYYFKEI